MAHQKVRPTAIAVRHVILESVLHILRGKSDVFEHNAVGLAVRLENHLPVIRRVEVVIFIPHLVKTLVSIGFFPHLSLRDVGKPRVAIVGVGNH